MKSRELLNQVHFERSAMRTLGRRENDSCMSASDLTLGVTKRIMAKETVIAVADATTCDSLGFQPEDHGRQVNQAAERRQVLRLGPPVVAPRLSLTSGVNTSD